MMKNHLIIYALFLLTVSCKDDPSQLIADETIEYYSKPSNQIFKKTIHYTSYDSVYYFYDNGVLFKKGKQYKPNQKIGIWKLYDRESHLREIREWFTINGESRFNRVWHLNKMGDTLAWRHEDVIFDQTEFRNDTVPIRNTTYDLIVFNKDTIKLSESIKGYVEILSPWIRNNTPHIRVFVAKDSTNYNYDFSNDSEAKLIKFNDLSIDTLNQKWFEGSNFNRLAVFGSNYKSVGNKILRGYYQEYSYGPFEQDEESKTKLDSIIGPKIYFEKKLYVIDSI